MRNLFIYCVFMQKNEQINESFCTRGKKEEFHMKHIGCQKVVGVLILMLSIFSLSSCTSRADSQVYFEDYSEVYLITHDSDKENRHRLTNMALQF